MRFYTVPGAGVAEENQCSPSTHHCICNDDGRMGAAEIVATTTTIKQTIALCIDVGISELECFDLLAQRRI